MSVAEYLEHVEMLRAQCRQLYAKIAFIRQTEGGEMSPELFDAVFESDVFLKVAEEYE